MSHFPEPIELPNTVPQARIQRKKQLQKSMVLGILIRTSIILFEFIGVYFFHSSALLLDALSSSLDVFCSLLLLFFIKLAEKPPDRNHPFGHGRFEPLAGLQLALMLVFVGVGMFVYQFYNVLENPSERTLDIHAWIVPFIAMMLLELCHFITMRAAKKYDSPAMESEAYHYRIDGLTSLFATIALVLVIYFPSWGDVIDRTGAILISLFMIFLGAKALKDNLNQIVDTPPEEEYFNLVRAAATDITGVLETEKIRIQQYGPDAHVDIDIEVDPNLSVEKGHEISQMVRRSIQKKWPAVRDVTVHIEPYYPNDHQNISKGESLDV